MPAPLVRVAVKVNAEIALSKLAKAQPRILAHNRLLAQQLLEEVQKVVFVETPVGPGHFGYHGRDTLKVTVSSKGTKTTGKLLAAIQLYWRERGTKRGERAFKTAHKALAAVKRFVKAYYGGTAKGWWS